MHPQPQEVQESPRSSPTIQATADLIMSLIEQDRLQERHNAAAVSQARHQGYLDEYKRQSRDFQNDQAQRLAQSERELADVRQRYNELQNLKRMDETMLQNLTIQHQTLKDERNYLQAKMIENQNMAYMAGAQASHANTVSELEKYGILYWGQNSLSFGEQWLQLWNQYINEDPQDIISSNDRITSKEMGILLENFLNQLRGDKDTIQRLEHHVSALRDERSFLFQLANKGPKSPPAETKSETVQDHFPDHRDHGQNDVQDYHYTHSIKPEPSLELSTTPDQFGPSDRLSGGPS